jgi:hypothetical protein
VWLDKTAGFGQAQAVETNPPLMEPVSGTPSPAMSLAGRRLNIYTAFTSGLK